MRIIFLCLLLAGCSLVQYMPSADCEHVKYERKGNIVDVSAEDCHV